MPPVSPDCCHAWQMLVEEAPDIKSGFKIVFTFLENHFFQNTVLEKDIRYLEDGSYEIKTTGPQWQPGQVLALYPVSIASAQLLIIYMRVLCTVMQYMHGSACHANLTDTGKLPLHMRCMAALVHV